MKVAVAGKGGSGKTTIAGTLARVMAERGHRVVAIDDDSNPNLALTIGVDATTASGFQALPRDLLEERTDAQGARWLELAVPAEDFIDRYGIPVREGLTLLVMGQPNHGGSG
jgi:CO dehydrogenase maturation factor